MRQDDATSSGDAAATQPPSPLDAKESLSLLNQTRKLLGLESHAESNVLCEILTSVAVPVVSGEARNGEDGQIQQPPLVSINTSEDGRCLNIAVSQAHLEQISSNANDIVSGYTLAQAEFCGIVVYSIAKVLWSRVDSAPGVPPGLVSGVADYARMRAGFEPKHWHREPESLIQADWDDGFDTTAFFLDWVDRNLCSDIVQKLSHALIVATPPHAWESARLWLRITGMPVEDCYKRYLADVAPAQYAAMSYRNVTSDDDGDTSETDPLPIDMDIWPDIKCSASVIQDGEATRAFRAAIPDPTDWIKTVTAQALREIYASPETAPRDIASVRLVVRRFGPNGGIAHTIGVENKRVRRHRDTQGSRTLRAKEIHLSVEYCTDVYERFGKDPKRLRTELDGLILHEAVHVVQHDACGSAPGWIIEGVADTVRLRAGLAPPHWSHCRGGTWTDGYSTTAYFLEWIDRTRGGGKGNNIIRLNASIADQTWNDGLFLEAMRAPEGVTVAALWQQYQDQIPIA